MKEQKRPPRSIYERLAQTTGVTVDDMRSSLPFFFILTIALIGISVWGLSASPRLRDAANWIPFIILMAIHLGLHWTCLFVRYTTRQLLVYLAFQGGLAMVLAFVSGVPVIAIGLFMALIGEAAGIIRQFSIMLVATLVYLGLSGAVIFFLGQPEDLRFWMITAIPMAIFVVIYVKLFNAQSEAREKAQQLSSQLEDANRQLADYALRVEELALASERQRMARELHDLLSAGLAGTILQLEAAETHLAGGHPERAHTIIQTAMQRARAALSDARALIDDLRAGVPQGIDLQERIEAEVRQFRSTSGLPCDLHLDLPPALSATYRECVARMVSESLINIARHARAQKAKVSIALEGDCLITEVCDDGSGFDLQAVGGQSGHYGLIGMQERARLAGGWLEVFSQPGDGTTVRMVLPMREGQSGVEEQEE